jgi:hypothetical protein
MRHLFLQGLQQAFLLCRYLTPTDGTWNRSMQLFLLAIILRRNVRPLALLWRTQQFRRRFVVLGWQPCLRAQSLMLSRRTGWGQQKCLLRHQQILIRNCTVSYLA